MSNPVKLNWSEQGQGTPVVLVHGFPFDHTLWRETQRTLGDPFRIITPDLRGHGDSPAPAGPYEMADLALDLLALLDRLNIDQAVLMGHSLGGYVTLAAWQLAPHRFSALGLISTQANADAPDTRRARETLADRVAREGAMAVAEGMIPKLFEAGTLPDDQQLSRVRQLILQTQPQGLIGTLQGMALRPDFSAALPTIAVPTLVMAGVGDQLIPPIKSEEMAAAIPRAQLVKIPNAGHLPMLENVKAVDLAIHQFLTKFEL